MQMQGWAAHSGLMQTDIASAGKPRSDCEAESAPFTIHFETVLAGGKRK
jgi:hypothetical protein